MYTAYFGLTENPFSLTPDPRFLFMSQRHREALAHLLYGMGDKGGFVLLTGEVGTGKTTLCRSLLDQVPEGVEVALVLNPKQTAFELVASLCDELKISYPEGTDSLKVLIDLLNLHLLDIHAKGRRTVLIIDEAQNLSIDVLEQVRLLTNLETSTRKLLQILLIGQPELQTMMSRPELRQLGQRITARYHLTPLWPDETSAYIRHRLEVAGCKRQLFTKGAVRQVHRLSEGVPRLVNTICDRALLGAYAKQREKVDRSLLRKAAAEVMGPGLLLPRRRMVGYALALWACLLLWAGWYFFFSPTTAEHTTTSQAGAPPRRLPPAPIAEVKTEQNPPDVQTPPDPSPSMAAPVKPVEAEAPHAYASLPAETFLDPPDILSQWLAADASSADMDMAFAALFKEWDMPFPDVPGMSACDRVARAGLRCFSDKGNWTTLRHLNRPAILELIDASQNRHYVAIVRMTDRFVTLNMGGREAVLDQADIEPYWFGDFTLLWKPPLLTASVLKEGDQGPDVLWLRAQLKRVQGFETGGAEADGRRGRPPSPRFDTDIKKQVMQFQRDNFVKPDGMVGEQTLIQLNRAVAGDAIPLLCALPPNGESHVVHP